MYISRFKSLIMPNSNLYSQKRAEKRRARSLVDSGATANFIDYKTVKRLGLGSLSRATDRQKTSDGMLNCGWTHYPTHAGLASVARKEARKDKILCYESWGRSIHIQIPLLCLNSTRKSIGLRPLSTDHVLGFETLV